MTNNKRGFTPTPERRLFGSSRKARSPRRLVWGFTLIETLVYLALFAIVIGGLMVVIYQIIESNSRNQFRVDVEEEGNFLLGKIEWALSGATAVSVTATTTLAVTKSSSSPLSPQNPFVFTLNSQNLELKRGSGSSTVLNIGSVAVTNLVFTDIPAVGAQPEAIKTSITLKEQSYGQSFETIKYLRK